MGTPCHKKTYYVLTLDPVHVGTGGSRLGRVDNTIVREPGTSLPKIPGSSLCGVARAYTAMAIQSESQVVVEKGTATGNVDYRNWKYRRPVMENDKGTFHSCAGKGAEDGEGHCGQPDCPVCVAFGFSKGISKSSFQGLAQFFDPRILFFPVRSMAGPVWITSPSVLESAGIRPSAGNNAVDWPLLNSELSELVEGRHSESFVLASEQLRGKTSAGCLNLGWLYLAEKKIKIVKGGIPTPTDWLAPTTDGLTMSLSTIGVGRQILENLVIVSDHLFSRLVNDNLEVRTSVAINPATGAGEDGALFTYEAIPRATVMWFDIVYNKPEYFDIKVSADSGGGTKTIPIAHGKTDGEGWVWLRKHVEMGLNLLELLGIGGMGTRGMGRLRILNNKETDQ